MATTTNYGWTTPDDTDLVKDGAAAIRTLGSSVDTTTKALNPSTTAGDIEYRTATANTNARLAIGTAGQVLTVNSGATAPEWATPAGSGGMTSIASGSLSTGTLSLTGIVATYKNLQLVVRDWNPSVDASLDLRLNNLSAGNSYSATGSFWNGSSTTNFGALGTSAPLTSQGTDGANYRNAMIIDIPDYTNTTANKFVNVISGYVSQNGLAYIVDRSTTMLNDTTTPAIDRIDLILSTGTFSAGTYILYGVE
jgi:hypothetical protein